MNATVLPELAAESVETAERLAGLSTKESLDVAEAEYILVSGLSAVQRVGQLWSLIRDRIGRGMIAAAARVLLVGMLDAVDRNLALVGTLKERARAFGDPERHEREAEAAAARLQAIRAEVLQLLRDLDSPTHWPTKDALREAKESMRKGDRLTADELRQALLDG